MICIINRDIAGVRLVAYYSFVPNFDEIKSSFMFPDDVIGEDDRELRLMFV